MLLAPILFLLLSRDPGALAQRKVGDRVNALQKALAWHIACGRAGDDAAWLLGWNEANALADWNAMEECADALLRKHPTSGAYLGMKGEALAKQGRFGAAEEVLNEAVHLEPRRAMSWADLACCLNERGAYEEAWEAANKGMAVEPALLEAVCNRGRANIGLKRYKQGRDDYAAALALGPKDPVVAANLRLNIAMADRYLATKAPRTARPGKP